MVSVKEIKSVELSSFTMVFTSIAVLSSIILSIVFSILIGLSTPNAFGVIIYLIPTIVVGAFMYGIYNAFCEGMIYNLLAKKLNAIKIGIKDGKEIVSISPTQTAIIISMIATIQVILIYLVSALILPLMLSTAMQTLMFSGQEMLAFSIYQILLLISQPITIAMIIFGTFIIIFVFVLLGCYIYNIVAGRGRGIEVELSNENSFTVIESVNMLKLAIVCAIIGGILNIITAIVVLLSGGAIVTVITNIIVGFVSGFIEGALLAIFYNFTASRIAKLKLELIDQ